MPEIDFEDITPSAQDSSDKVVVRRGSSAPFNMALIDPPSGGGEVDPLILAARTEPPAAPASGQVSLYARHRAGVGWIDYRRSNGITVPVGPHPGYSRLCEWRPNSGASVTALAMNLTTVGTVTHPVLTATNRATSMRRWRVTSAATANAIASNRAAVTMVWRGNGPRLGGWIFTSRISLAALAATGTGFVGLTTATSATPTGQQLLFQTGMLGIGFQRGTHDNWQVAHNGPSGDATLIDMGAGFPVEVDRVLTVTIAAAPNDTSVWVRVVNEDDEVAFETEITTNFPSETVFLAPRIYLSNLGTAQAVAYDCAGVYLESEF